jgi:hypothetical protein
VGNKASGARWRRRRRRRRRRRKVECYEEGLEEEAFVLS